MTPVGLDLSLTSTGVSVGQYQTTLKSKNKGPLRLIEIRDQLLELLHGIDKPIVIVENYSFGSRNSQAHATGELGGVVRVALYAAGIPYVEVPPTCRAKFATGKGNAGKNEVISAISARTGITWSGAGADDLCDAWILEECGRVKLGIARYDWPQVNLSALDKVDWTSLGQVAIMMV